MSILITFKKQPAEVQDYDIDFTDWLAEMDDTAVSQVTTISGPDDVATLDPAPQLIVTSTSVVKVWVTGGTGVTPGFPYGCTYKITTKLTTGAGRVKEVEINVKVKDT